MNSKITHAAAFIFGAIAGGAAIWQFARKKFERIAEEEIRSVKETYSRREAVVVKSARDRDEENVVEYAARLRREGYLPDDADKEKEANKTMPADDGPYVISPDEFGEVDGYENISLTYYSDGVLADDNYEVIENVDEIVGSESLNHFGEYEEDSVFVRNDTLKCDYEILLDQRPYSEVLKARPYLRRKE